MTEELDLDTISDDAKAIAGAWFALMVPDQGELTFQMIESKPSERAQRALDELVEKRLVTRRQDRQAIIYVPQVGFRPCLKWLNDHLDTHNFELTEVIGG